MGIQFGKDARKSFARGDIVCSLQYVNDEEAACFYPAPHARRKGAAAYVICLSAVYKYTDEAYLVQQAAKAAEVMHLGHNKSTVKKLADFMADMLIEVYTMPPKPVDTLAAIAERERIQRVDIGPTSARIVVG